MFLVLRGVVSGWCAKNPVICSFLWRSSSHCCIGRSPVIGCLSSAATT